MLLNLKVNLWLELDNLTDPNWTPTTQRPRCGFEVWLKPMVYTVVVESERWIGFQTGFRCRVGCDLPAVFGDDHFVGQLLKFAPEIAFFERDAALAFNSAGWIRFDESASAGAGQRDSAFRRWQNVLRLVVVVDVQGGFVHFKSHPHPEFRTSCKKKSPPAQDSIRNKEKRVHLHWKNRRLKITAVHLNNNNNKTIRTEAIQFRNSARKRTEATALMAGRWLMTGSFLLGCYLQPAHNWLVAVRPEPRPLFSSPPSGIGGGSAPNGPMPASTNKEGRNDGRRGEEGGGWDIFLFS